jgi:hypothetical protein
LVPWQKQRKLPSFLNRYSGTLQPYLSSSFERFGISSITSWGDQADPWNLVLWKVMLSSFSVVFCEGRIRD